MCLKDTKIAENDFVQSVFASIKRNRFRRICYSKPVIVTIFPWLNPSCFRQEMF